MREVLPTIEREQRRKQVQGMRAPQEKEEYLMARKSSKVRKTARRKRRLKALDAILTRRVALDVMAGKTSIMAATCAIEEPYRSRAIILTEQLSAD